MEDVFYANKFYLILYLFKDFNDILILEIYSFFYVCEYVMFFNWALA